MRLKFQLLRLYILICSLSQFFVEILKAKGTLKQDIREGIFSTIKDIHSVNQ